MDEEMITEILRTTFQPFGDKVTVTRYDGFRETSEDVDLKSLDRDGALQLLQKIYDFGRIDALSNVGRDVSDSRHELANKYPRKDW